MDELLVSVAVPVGLYRKQSLQEVRTAKVAEMSEDECEQAIVADPEALATERERQLPEASMQGCLHQAHGGTSAQGYAEDGEAVSSEARREYRWNRK